MEEYSQNCVEDTTVLAYGSDIEIGDMLSLVDQYTLGTYNAVPLVTIAPADVSSFPYSTYVGVATTSAAEGEQLSMRLWSAGTILAKVEMAVGEDRGAGYTFSWNGTAFASNAVYHALSLKHLTYEDNGSLTEFIIVKGGPK